MRMEGAREEGEGEKDGEGERQREVEKLHFISCALGWKKSHAESNRTARTSGDSFFFVDF